MISFLAQALAAHSQLQWASGPSPGCLHLSPLGIQANLTFPRSRPCALGLRGNSRVRAHARAHTHTHTHTPCTTTLQTPSAGPGPSAVLSALRLRFESGLSFPLPLVGHSCPFTFFSWSPFSSHHLQRFLSFFFFFNLSIVDLQCFSCIAK